MAPLLLLLKKGSSLESRLSKGGGAGEGLVFSDRACDGICAEEVGSGHMTCKSADVGRKCVIYSP